MKPLILEFAETPTMQNLDFSLIEYSRKQNLSVLKGTETAAIAFVNMETETVTLVSQEPTDSDNNFKNQAKYLLDTTTETKVLQEASDSDFNRRHQARNLLDTTTGTRVSQESSDNDNDRRLQMKYLLDTRTDTFTQQEASDNDNDRNSLMRLMDTQTITESQEPTDADK